MNKSKIKTWLKRNGFKKLWTHKSTVLAKRRNRYYQIHKDDFGNWVVRISMQKQYFDRWENSTLTYMPLETFVLNFPLMSEEDAILKWNRRSR